MSNQSGPNSGGDLFDMAQDGTSVPEDAAKPRYIPSKPRPDEIASETDPNDLGGRNIAEAATNAGDIPRASFPNVLKRVYLPSSDDTRRCPQRRSDRDWRCSSVAG